MKKKGKLIGDYASMIFGCFLAAAALYTYIIPNKFVAGGVGGIASLLEIAGLLKAWLGTLLFNLPLLVLALVFLNRQFALRTVFCTVLISLMMKLMEEIAFPVFTADRLLAAIYSGILYGIGLALFYESNSSSGGSEIVAQLVIRKKPDYNIAFILFLMDAAVMVVSWTVCDFWSVAYAIISAICSAKAMDIYLRGFDLPVVYYIVTEKADQVANALFEYLQSGATKIKLDGNFGKRGKDVVTIVVKYRNIARFKRLLNETDNQAFVFSVATRSVLRRSYNKREG